MQKMYFFERYNDFLSDFSEF